MKSILFSKSKKPKTIKNQYVSKWLDMECIWWKSKTISSIYYESAIQNSVGMGKIKSFDKWANTRYSLKRLLIRFGLCHKISIKRRRSFESL